LGHEQLVEALQLLQGAAGKRLGRLLVEQGALDERDLARVLASQQSLAYVDLRQVAPDGAATGLLSEQTARALVAVPISIDLDQVVVAVAEPSDDMRARPKNSALRTTIRAIASAA